MEAKQLGKHGDGVTVSKREEEPKKLEECGEKEIKDQDAIGLWWEKNEKGSLEMREEDVKWGRKVGKK